MIKKHNPPSGVRNTITILSLVLGFFSLTGISQAQDSVPVPTSPITLQSLLNEMIDRDAAARFPAPLYESLQASSYNRASTSWDQADQGTNGWFADSDGNQAIRIETNPQGQNEWVAMEHDGPGALTKFWAPFFYYSFSDRKGPNIRIYLDGEETPTIDENFIEFITRLDWDPAEYGGKPSKQNSFEVPSPFADYTARAGNLYLPIPFAKSCKVTFSSQAFFNIINYRTYPQGTTVVSFTKTDYDAAEETLRSVGAELNNPSDFSGGALTEQRQTLQPGADIDLALPQGSHAIKLLEIELDPSQIEANPELLRNLVLSLTFDGAESVWCPVGDFFSSSNRLNELKTWTRTVNPETGLLKCRWVMPYQNSASMTLTNLGTLPASVSLLVRTEVWTWGSDSMHFRADWRPDLINKGNEFSDINFIDIAGQGVYVGDSWTVLNLKTEWWGEGDEKIYIDDDYEVRKFPSHFGTGTEDYYGWAGGEHPRKVDFFNHPFLANAEVGSFEDDTSKGFNIATRIRALDAIPFSNRLRVDIEASPGVTQRNFHDLLMYSSAVFWYAVPGATDNRPPQAQAAAGPITSFDVLDAQSNLLESSGGVLVIPGAIEAETLAATATDGIVPVRNSPDASQNPNLILSAGEQLLIPFTQAGQAATIPIIEQFNPKLIELYLSKSPNHGVIDVFINDTLIREDLDLFNPSLAVQKLNLGYQIPENTRFNIRLELKQASPQGQPSATAAAIDAVVLSDLPPQLPSSAVWPMGEEDEGAVDGVTSEATISPSAPGLTLTAFGGPSYTSETTPGSGSSLAVELDGADDYYQLQGVGYSDLLARLDPGEFSITLKARPVTIGAFNFVASLGGNLPGGYGLLQQGGKWGIIRQGVELSLGNIDVELDQWVELSLVHGDFGNGEETRLLVDGVDSGASVAGRSTQIANFFTVGANQLSATVVEGFFNGQVDDLRVESLSIRTAYQQFVSSFFPQTAELATIGTLADPDGDGLKNSIEFLFQTDPSKANPSISAQVSLAPGQNSTISSSWDMDPAASQSIYWEIQASSDLKTWKTIYRSTDNPDEISTPLLIEEVTEAPTLSRFHRILVPEQN